MAVADRKVTCTNADGVSVEFTEDLSSPFILMSISGVYTVDNTVSMTDNTMINGATYQGSVAKKRNIVLYIKDMYDFYDHRNLLNEVFKQNERGKLVIEDEGVKRAIGYYVESVNGNKIKPHIHYHTISLMCDDPFFTTVHPNNIYIAEWVPGFEWPHNFLSKKETFGYRSQVRMRTIENVDAIEDVGLDIIITCTNTIQNPMLAVIERNQRIHIGDEEHPFTMGRGDILEITTGEGNKHVYLTHDGVKQEMNYLMTEDSDFIQLRRGTNSIGYDAEAGAQYMVIRIRYNMQYARA